MPSKSGDALAPYRRWRKKTAKRLKCSEDAIDAAVKEGHGVWKIMVERKSPLLDVYRASFQPMFVVCFLVYLYARNPLLKSLMVNDGAQNPV